MFTRVELYRIIRENVKRHIIGGGLKLTMTKECVMVGSFNGPLGFEDVPVYEYSLSGFRMEFDINVPESDLIERDAIRYIMIHESRKYHGTNELFGIITELTDYDLSKSYIKVDTTHFKSRKKISSVEELTSLFMNHLYFRHYCNSCDRETPMGEFKSRAHGITPCCYGMEQELLRTGEYVEYATNIFRKDMYDRVMSDPSLQDRNRQSAEFIGDFLTVYVNTFNENRNSVRLINRHTIKCKHRHIAKIPQINLNGMDKPLECPMCKNIKDIEFFKLLDELGVMYTIKEQIIPQSCIPKKLASYERKIIKYIVLTYNEKGHLTGKIVFNDFDGAEQVKAKKNNLVYRWLMPSHVNDREFCKSYLYDYFEEINRKHNLE